MTDLFAAAGLEDQAPRPLAERLRPQTLADVVGQDHLLGPQKPLGRMLAGGSLRSLVLWGPPGTGKTTIARLLAKQTGLTFEQLSAIGTGVADLRKLFDAAKSRHRMGQGTLLFIDEIHRFNKAQQDGFLSHVEDGTIILVGATTENPSFELNPALLSRMQVLVLERLDKPALRRLVDRAEAHFDRPTPVTDDAMAQLLAMADGDGRYLLGALEQLFAAGDRTIDAPGLTDFLAKRAAVYDKAGEAHFNLISAFHKALRASDADAALYWLARMLTAGEDPLYAARRMVRFASEDIGLADPSALPQALAAREAYALLGSPEGELALVQAALYLATAPKSNAAYRAQKAAWDAAAKTGSLPPPKHSLNAPTAMMKDLGYGAGYAYDHDSDSGFSGQNHFPDTLARQQFYQPVDRGFEREIAKRLAHWHKRREEGRL